MSRELRISCENCAMQNSVHCGDCVVSFLCDRLPTEAVVFDFAEAKAVKLLAEAGLVPECAHVPRSA